MPETTTRAATREPDHWRSFYDLLRADVIEAQCALESGRVVRASEIIDSILRRAQRAGSRIAPRPRARRIR